MRGDGGGGERLEPAGLPWGGLWSLESGGSNLVEVGEYLPLPPPMGRRKLGKVQRCIFDLFACSRGVWESSKYAVVSIRIAILWDKDDGQRSGPEMVTILGVLMEKLASV